METNCEYQLITGIEVYASKKKIKYRINEGYLMKMTTVSIVLLILFGCATTSHKEKEDEDRQGFDPCNINDKLPTCDNKTKKEKNER